MDKDEFRFLMAIIICCFLFLGEPDVFDALKDYIIEDLRND